MEEELEAWEALDVDDSDLSSFLRPCKRHNPSSPNNSQPPPPPHLIPGPAGEVQAAMIHRRALSHRLSPVLPTQEFIRRVIQNGSDQTDRDFKSDAWLSALEFVRQRGIVDGDCVMNESVTRLSSIKKHRSFGIVPQVVAVIKSCTLNGFGDMMVTLKDPTTTIGATVHHKVFTEEQFRKDITVGSALVLHKVAVFSPTPSSCYLNITLRNIVKVFSKDTGPPSEQVYPTQSVRRPTSSIERNEKSWKELTPLLGNTLSLPQKRTEGIMTSLRLDLRCTEVASSDKQNEEKLVQTSFHSDNGNEGNQENVFDREELSPRQDNAHTPVEVTCGGVLGSEIGDQPNPPKLGAGDNSAHSAQGNSSSTNSARTSDGQESGINDHLDIQKEIVNPENSIPHWTDEQLDELLAFD
ncbi:hypothetical protein Lal_00029931 [Lupinus albus]|uniref:Homologous recombination OB-fold protein OB-fold domain-containing protein n=1 Tax=Lupinus albus TaxID=3870 RepID=A0A6A5MIE1_LUPAL|nr:hypothetical protein Lalb_Chr16g0386991 [Lupinus albus]KAF1874504.1 hypothetical protein Lal_00029931 [Lupinus albus]